MNYTKNAFKGIKSKFDTAVKNQVKISNVFNNYFPTIDQKPKIISINHGNSSLIS